jgi:hypothetical protein
MAGNDPACERQPLEPAKEFDMAAPADRRSFVRWHRAARAVVLGGALLVAVGLVAPTAILADDCSPTGEAVVHTGISQNQQAIELTEGKDPANTAPSEITAFVPISRNAHSLELTEGKDPANFSPTAIEDSDSDTVAAPADSPHTSRTAF